MIETAIDALIKSLVGQILEPDSNILRGNNVTI